ncbi:MAG: hypothetical protein ABGZ35_06600 [Planctomycetaceae bacterium]|jgi:hypothetical protein
MNWQLIWQVVFVGLLFGFGGMSVLVIINGARDVRRLIAHLEEARNPADHSRQDESLPE